MFHCWQRHSTRGCMRVKHADVVWGECLTLKRWQKAVEACVLLRSGSFPLLSPFSKPFLPFLQSCLSQAASLASQKEFIIASPRKFYLLPLFKLIPTELFLTLSPSAVLYPFPIRHEHSSGLWLFQSVQSVGAAAGGRVALSEGRLAGTWYEKIKKPVTWPSWPAS